MSQTVNIPTLGLHDLAHVKLREGRNSDQCDNPNGGSLMNTNAMGSAGNSIASTPRSPPSGQTPRTPIRSTSSAFTAMHSPLRMVGRTSPCSVKIKASTRLEGGLLVEMPSSSCAPKAKNVEGSADYYPRELSFGNLLDNEGVESRNTGHAQHPEPIGFRQSTDHAPVSEYGDSLPISPRKRSRKCLPPAYMHICVSLPCLILSICLSLDHVPGLRCVETSCLRYTFIPREKTTNELL